MKRILLATVSLIAAGWASTLASTGTVLKGVYALNNTEGKSNFDPTDAVVVSLHATGEAYSGNIRMGEQTLSVQGSYRKSFQADGTTGKVFLGQADSAQNHYELTIFYTEGNKAVAHLIPQKGENVLENTYILKLAEL